MVQQEEINSFVDLLDDEARTLLKASGTTLIKKIGLDTARTVVLDVLSGRNLRDSTEMLTRRRLAALNVATVAMMLRGIAIQSDFIEKLPEIAERILRKKRLSKSERWMAQWLLGLTDKASQNVLRDNANLLTEYRQRYQKIYEDVIAQSISDFGRFNAQIYLDDQFVADISWKFMLYLLGAVGAQTLAIRGSEKSLYGKLFERLVLGSLLHILGFEYTDTPGAVNFQREFWLSSQGEKRESDATALWEAGKGARFDIGFIGRGNPEISLDKVTRFEREIQLGQSTWYMATLIIVDRIGKGSRIKELARRVDGDIVQMSMAYWPQEVARILNQRMGFEHPLVDMAHSEIHGYLQQMIQNVPLEKFLPESLQNQESPL
ncbi:MAG: CfrBI family restriction endonuclease [Caldilineae bacterium]|nr:MAG: CfrBI family restriction endonuclease [Caldilineae bacterium]